MRSVSSSRLGEPGEGVVIGLVYQPLVQLLAFGYVLRQGEARLAAFKQDAVGCGVDLDSGAIFPPVGPGPGDKGGFAFTLQAAIEIQRLFRRNDVANRHRVKFASEIAVMEHAERFTLRKVWFPDR